MAFNEQHMDRLLREKLERLSEGLSPAHWELLQSRLDAGALDLTQADFDERFKSALDHGFPIGTPDWDNFSDLLEQSESADFDAHIAEGLTKAAPAALPDWDRFADLLEANETADLTTDNNLVDQSGSRLQHVEEPYNPEHWPLMNEKIEEHFSFRRKLVRFKVAELSLMFLFLFTVANFLPVNKLGKLFVLPKVASEQSEGQPNWHDLKQDARAKSNTTQIVDRTNSTSGEETVVVPSETTESAVDLPRVIASAESRKTPTRKTTPTPPRNIITLEQDFGQLPVTLSSAETPDHVALQRLQTEAATAETEPRGFKNWLLNRIGNRKTEAPVSNDEAARELPKVSLPHQKGAYVAAFGSVGANRIYSPYDQVFNLQPDTTYSGGFGAGLQLGWYRNRTHLRTGIHYHAIAYDPSVSSSIGDFYSGYSNENFERIKWDIIQIPVNVRQDLLSGLRWKVYGNLGVTANLIAFTDYRISNISLTSLSRPVVEVDPQEEIEEVSSTFANKLYPGGMLEGGHLRDNLFLSATLGLGVERSFGRQFKLFLEPVYHHQISMRGIGPNENTFRAWSLRFGSRYMLDRREGPAIGQ